MKLTLSYEVWHNIRKHAEADYPDECCGFIFGRDGEIRKICRSRRTANIQAGNRRRRFRIDPKDYRSAEKFALDSDLDFLGVYHSHPDHSAEPSEHDRSVAMPYFSYIIVSVSEGRISEFRSWRLKSEEIFIEESIDILPKQEQKYVKQQISE